MIGLQADNVLVDAGGKVYRVDNGGSLRYRARGKLKAAGQFGPEVGEIHSLRAKNINPSAAKVFGDLADKEIKAQAKAIGSKASRKAILDAAPADLKKTLAERLDRLAEYGKPLKKGAARGFGTDTAAMDAWGKATYDKWAESLTKDERAAVKKYTGSYYRAINDLYRKGEGDVAVKAIARNLEAAMAKANLPEPVRSFRGIKDWTDLGLVKPTPEPGVILAEASPASTSLYRKKAEEFAGSGPPSPHDRHQGSRRVEGRLCERGRPLHPSVGERVARGRRARPLPGAWRQYLGPPSRPRSRADP